MNNPIGIFDSGLGGLSIYKAVKRLLPREDFICLSDHKNLPYGSKKPQELRSLTIRALHYLSKRKVKAVIIACNTSTTAGIEDYRKLFSFPIIGVVPAIKKASEKTKSGVIGILSTPATAKSKYQKNLISKFCKDLIVINACSKNLVPLIETEDLNSDKITKELTIALKSIIYSKADVLVLGCTHYPFVKKIINKIAPNLKILDSGSAVAKQTRKVLNQSGKIKKASVFGKSLFLTTGNSFSVSQAARKLLNSEVTFKKIIN